MHREPSPVDERLDFEEFLHGEEALGWMALDLTFEVQGLKESMLEPPELVVPWRRKSGATQLVLPCEQVEITSGFALLASHVIDSLPRL